MGSEEGFTGNGEKVWAVLERIKGKGVKMCGGGEVIGAHKPITIQNAVVFCARRGLSRLVLLSAFEENESRTGPHYFSPIFVTTNKRMDTEHTFSYLRCHWYEISKHGDITSSFRCI